jgi:DNA-binding CsgD family transcriptional regulator
MCSVKQCQIEEMDREAFEREMWSINEPRLTRRQTEVFELLKQGFTDKQIALQLHMGEGTVKHHTSALRKKYGVHNRLALTYSNGNPLVNVSSTRRDKMRRLNGISVTQHLSLGKDISKVVETLMAVTIFVGNNYGKSSRAIKRLDVARKALDSVRSELDSDYHRQITDEQFKKYGHVYYRASNIVDYKKEVSHDIRQQSATI